MASDQVGELEELCRAVDKAFRDLYGQSPTFLVGAPGRVNLIGEHTDYNDGFVLPAAIDQHVVMAVGPRHDRHVRLCALDFNQGTTFALDDIEPVDRETWSNYQRGVAWALQEEGYTLQGLDAVISSDIPIGSGLSSSAAVEVVMAYAFQIVSELELDGVERALVCQRAENDFVGMRCGIMDQYIISLGERDHALFIDCRSLDYKLVPIPSGFSVVVCDTKKRRGLVDSEYNARRQECERGAEILGVPALRDVTSQKLEANVDRLDPVTLKRCRHVVTENARVVDAVEALKRGDVAAFGQLMNASHVSLRDDYEVSCEELDIMVEAGWEQEGVAGARMTGAGFGGCTVNLVRSEMAQVFKKRVANAYQEATGIAPDIYVCRAAEGVRRLEE
jgi:galactokinase